jgi:hypothetical protein
MSNGLGNRKSVFKGCAMHRDENDFNNRFEERGSQGRFVSDPSTWDGAEDWL